MQNELKVWIVSHGVMKDPNDKILIFEITENIGLG